MNEQQLREQIFQEIMAIEFITPSNDPMMQAMFNAQNVAKMRIAQVVRGA